MARKLSARNRTEAATETHADLASILRTCRRQCRDILGVLVELLRRRGRVTYFNCKPPPIAGLMDHDRSRVHGIH